MGFGKAPQDSRRGSVHGIGGDLLLFPSSELFEVGAAGSAGAPIGAPPFTPLKNALANRSIAPASGMKAPARTGSTSGAETGAPVRSGVGMGIFGIAADLDIVENGKRVLRQHGERAIERDEIGGDGLAIDAHEADRKARRYFARNAGLE